MQSKSAEEEKTPLDQDDDSQTYDNHGGSEQDVLLDRVPQSNRLGVEVT